MIRIDRKLFKQWTEGKFEGRLMYRCIRADLQLRKGKTIALTIEGATFSHMRMEGDQFIEYFNVSEEDLV